MRNLESSLQISSVKWFRLQYPKLILFAIANGGNRSAITGSILKQEGVLAGVADLFLLKSSKEFHGLFIEMKVKNGKQSPTQKVFQQKCEENNYKYVVCNNIESFINGIENYVKRN